MLLLTCCGVELLFIRLLPPSELLRMEASPILKSAEMRSSGKSVKLSSKLNMSAGKRYKKKNFSYYPHVLGFKNCLPEIFFSSAKPISLL